MIPLLEIIQDADKNVGTEILISASVTGAKEGSNTNAQ